eukprot:2328408-Amphidinium_carterae.2
MQELHTGYGIDIRGAVENETPVPPIATKDEAGSLGQVDSARGDRDVPAYHLVPLSLEDSCRIALVTPLE